MIFQNLHVNYFNFVHQYVANKNEIRKGFFCEFHIKCLTEIFGNHFMMTTNTCVTNGCVEECLNTKKKLAESFHFA